MATNASEPRRRLEYNESQKAGVKLLQQFPFVALIGPAGSGKTHLALDYAAKLIRKQQAERIYFVRKPSEMGRSSVGFIPGDVNEKMAPFVAHAKEMAKDVGLSEHAISVVPLCYVQGRTFSDSIVIVDECQTLDIPEFRGIFTRLGKNSQMIFVGDPTQDSRREGKLKLFLSRVEGLSCFGVQYFTAADNMRHPAINEVWNATEDL